MSDNASKPMVTLTIGGKEVTVPAGTTVLEAAKQAGYEIPHFCYHPGLPTDGNCRMCMCEIFLWDARNNREMPQRKPLITCTTPVADKMRVEVDSEKTRQYRAQIMEFLLINHPLDCPICDKAGECMLQDHYYSHDARRSELRDAKVSKPRLVPMSDRILYNGDRCILCRRCTRFTKYITKSHELGVVNRGDRAYIDVIDGGMTNRYQDCVSDICPVGALTQTKFRFKKRVWYLKHARSVCWGCSRGCNTVIDHDGHQIYRIMPRHNEAVNDYWMCDEGRDLYETRLGERLVRPTVKGAEASWDQALAAAAELLKADPKRTAVLASGNGSNEEAAVAAALFAEVPASLRAVKSDWLTGDPGDDILRTADDNANRKGVVAAGFAAPVEEVVEAIRGGAVDTVVVWGRGAANHLGDGLKDAFGKVQRVLYLGFEPDPVADLATVCLPVLAPHETAGSYTNIDGITSAFEVALRGPGSARSAVRVFADLAARTARTVPGARVEEVAAAIGTPVLHKNPRPPGTLFRHASGTHRP